MLSTAGIDRRPIFTVTLNAATGTEPLIDHVRIVPVQYRFRKQLWLVVLASTAVGLAVLLSTRDFVTKRVQRDTLLIGSVERGELDIKISANGVLLPRKVEWLAAQVEGRVSRILVRPGYKVERGQVLVEISNPALITGFEEAESALNGGRAELLAFTVELENQLLNQRSVTMRARFDYESIKIQLQAETRLRKQSRIIPDIDYQRTRLMTEQRLETYHIEQEKYEKSKANMKTQLAAKGSQVMQLEKALERAKNNVVALNVSAGISGVVQVLPLTVGQRVQAGSEIARVAQQGDLYAELRIPARQASAVARDQPVSIDTRNGIIEGVVSRIDPAVIEGAVVVDVDLKGEQPRGARPELPVEGIVYIARLRDTLFMAKPAFSKPDSDINLYRLDADRRYARRTRVKLGRASVSQIEILSGLAPGDQVILSDSSDWQEHSRILIN